MFQKFKLKLENKNAKTLIENFVSLSVLQLVESFLPLITLPYLARVIGVEKFGELAFATAVMAYFIAIVDFGFNYVSVREISRCKDDVNQVSKIYSNVLFAKSILTVISFLLLLLCIYFIPIFRDNKLLLLLTFLQIPGRMLFPDWFFQGMEKMKFMTIMNTISKGLFTILIFVIIKEESDYIYHPVLFFLGFFVSGMIAQVYIFNNFNIRLIVPSIEELKQTYKDSWDVFLSVFFPNIYSNFSGVLLQAYFGSYANGIFDAGNKFTAISQKVTNLFSRTFYPFLARRIDKHSFYTRITFVTSILIGLVLFIFADLIISLFFTEAFNEAVDILRIMSVSLVFIFLTNTYGTNYLLLVKQEKVYKRIVMYSSIIGFGLSYFLIYNFSYIGAAINFVAIRGLIGILTWYFAVKHKKNTAITVS